MDKPKTITLDQFKEIAKEFEKAALTPEQIETIPLQIKLERMAAINSAISNFPCDIARSIEKANSID